MIYWLDSQLNTRTRPQENFGREIMELFSLGIGNYTESDVRAGATALTGWTAPYFLGHAEFHPGRHDDTPQHYLGRSGVHDVDTVVDAIVSHRACAPFITGKLARAILGPTVDTGLVARLAKDFAASGLQLRPLVRSIVEAGLDGASTPLVQAPVPWTTSMLRASGIPWAAASTAVGRVIVEAGQIPLGAPNVGGWPGGPLWLTSSVTLARCDLAAELAGHAAVDRGLAGAAAAGDWASLADRLGRPEGFSSATLAALRRLPSGPRPAVARLSVAIAAPDLAIA